MNMVIILNFPLMSGKDEKDTIQMQKLDKLMVQLKKTLNKVSSLQLHTIEDHKGGYLAKSRSNNRDNYVTTIRCLHIFYGFGSDTFSSAICYLDKILSVTKVHAKYLSCLAAACYFMAAKVHEDDPPTASHIVQVIRSTWTPSDLCRMESVLLSKLKWNLMIATPVTFLEQFYQIACLLHPGLEDSLSIDEIISKLEVFVCSIITTQYQMSSVALCVLRWCLEKTQNSSSFVEVGLLQLQSFCMISDAELFECRNSFLQSLSSYRCQTGNPKPRAPGRLRFKHTVSEDPGLPTVNEHS